MHFLFQLVWALSIGLNMTTDPHNMWKDSFARAKVQRRNLAVWWCFGSRSEVPLARSCSIAAEEAELCIEGGACGLVTCWGAKMSQTACTDAHDKTQAANWGYEMLNYRNISKYIVGASSTHETALFSNFRYHQNGGGECSWRRSWATRIPSKKLSISSCCCCCCCCCANKNL